MRKENEMLRPLIYAINAKSVIFILLLAISASATAQNDPHIVTDKHLQVDASSKEHLYTNYIHFHNVGVVSYYFDKRELSKINKLEAAGKHEALVTALETYVSNFGIGNFGRDIKLMFLLAQLYEDMGKLNEAKWLYRIILKHTNFNQEYVEQYYNDLTRLEKDYYVPIEYYYDLVEYRKMVDTLRPPRGVFISIGNTVNSEYEDYGPSLNATDDVLLFASKRNRTKFKREEIVNEDMYWSRRTGEATWSQAEPLEGLNTRYQEGAPCLSKDGKVLYFVRCDNDEVMGSCDLFQAEWLGDKWGNVRNMGPHINSNKWDSHPSLSHSGDTLFFVSEREGGFGSNDVYYTYKNKQGQWAPAKNMGPIINTKGNDISPFYHPVHHVLYFSSNGHILNFGNFDIYKSLKINGEWTEPKNIGPLVNGEGDENFFAIDSKSKDLFYSRSEVYDVYNLNIYTFPLPMGAQPTATTTFKGSLVDSITGEAFQGIVSIIDLENGIEVAPKYLRPDGSFEFDLINNNKYLLVIQGQDFFRIEKMINLQSDTAIQMKTPSINYLRIQFESIEFSTNSAEILKEMEPDLDKLLDFILDNPTVTLNISGHTDAVGDPEFNLKLSQKRADAIKAYLVTRGHIDPERIDAEGFGSNKPIVKDAKTEAEHKINRRVEFEIIRTEDMVGKEKTTAG